MGNSGASGPSLGAGRGEPQGGLQAPNLSLMEQPFRVPKRLEIRSPGEAGPGRPGDCLSLENNGVKFPSLGAGRGSLKAAFSGPKCEPHEKAVSDAETARHSVPRGRPVRGGWGIAKAWEIVGPAALVWGQAG